MTAPGGYQRPSNPAPVSGPGALSRRTDGGPAQPVRELPDAQYGEGKAFRETQQAAPLAASPSGPSGGLTPVSPPNVVGFDEPTTKPGEPVTAGAAMGPGPNSIGGRTAPQMGKISATLSRLAASDASGGIAALLLKAQERGL